MKGKTGELSGALTAGDRPYRPGKTLTEALKILGHMCEDNYIDEDLSKISIDKIIYLEYADAHLDRGQIDQADPLKIPGYQ